MKLWKQICQGLIVGSAVFLSGCAGTSPESRMASVKGMTPGSWAATKEGRTGIDRRWVSRIGGSQLASLADEAISNHPDIRAAAAGVERAVQVAKTAGAQMKPQISAALDGNRSKQNFIGLPIGGGGVPSSVFSSYGAKLTVAWEPDVWGYKRAGQEALIAQAQAEEQNLRAARASLAAQVSRAWLALAESNEQIVLAQEALKARRDTASLIRDRFAVALADQGGTASQLRLAATEVETSKEALARRQGERAQAIRQLELLLGRYPSGRLTTGASLSKVPSRPPAGLPSELLLRRPDILAAERQLAASGRLLKQGELAFYPSFTLTARGGTSTDSLSKVINSDFGVWSLAGNLTQPIWAGGALRFEYARLGADDRRALSRLQGVVLKAFGEVEQALVAESYLARRESAMESALESAREAEKAALDDYLGATGDVLTILSAQNMRIQLASQKISLRRLRLDNRVSLHLALGGDYRVGK